MREVAVALCLCLLFSLLPSCGYPPEGPVSCRSALPEDSVRPVVKLSDGELLFVQTPQYVKYGESLDGRVGHGVSSLLRDWAVPESAERLQFTYADITARLQCDLVQVLTDAGVSVRCIPGPDDIITDGIRLTEDYTVRHSVWLNGEFETRTVTRHAGELMGGDVYFISHAPDEELPWMLRYFGLSANRTGELVALYISDDAWYAPANSRVGEIPVYINYYRAPAPSLGGWETDEFFARFDIAGFTYALLARDYTQQEFVDVLLAIINYYGTYPSQE